MSNLRIVNSLYYILLGVLFCNSNLVAQSVDFKVNYQSFLSKHDMVWDYIPNQWEVAPFSGNGNVGFLFYRTKSEGKNMMSIYAGRHDYYDHRQAPKENQMLWIYRSRLPLGHFNLESKGEIESVNLRLSLWNAELTGVIKTSRGSYQIHGFTHSTTDIIYFETVAQGDESIKITWHPEAPVPPVWETLQAGGGPQGETWDKMRKAPMIMQPPPTLSETDGLQFCYQPLYMNRGETTTGWKITGNENGTQKLIASIYHSFPEHNSMEVVKKNLLQAIQSLGNQTFIASHRKWWHDYYPQSFLTINDPEKESFYWIQMYKFASATRGNGPLLDLMGPWYNKTFWPMVWGDLNVELEYWTGLTANRLSVGESLPNAIDQYEKNLEGNVPERWKNSAAVAALMPQDLDAYNGAKVPDMLAWILNDYWLYCQYAGDRERMRDKLFPLLKKTVNSYRNYLKENPVESTDGKIHIKMSWSPEYKPGHGQDINFTLALIRWSCQTLVNMNNEFKLNDPLVAEWQKILDHLVEFQTDGNGLRIGKDIPFDRPHRHYSHLLGFYPLAVITPETEANKKLLRTTLDHWLDVSINNVPKDKAMKVTGYTLTGAASMYACLGDAEKAYHYLDMFIKHKNVSPTTMYSEGKGNPVIESPLSYATSIHDMLLQSWEGKIRVFPASPKRWKDVAFNNLRTQGAFLVSAKKIKGKTEFVVIKSLKGNECIVQTDIENPRFYINGKPISSKKSKDGFYNIDLKKDESVIITSKLLKETDLTIQELPKTEADENLFGYSKKTKRLPGHQYYSKNSS